MNHLLFSAGQKMADLIHLNYRLLMVLPRFGIRLGFGEKTVLEVCEMYGADCSLFLTICNVYTFDEYLPGPELETFDISQLVDYLRKSHQDYLENRIPALRVKLDHLTSNATDEKSKIVKRFYIDYFNEVVNHFRYEESTVFPYIDKLTIDPSGINGYHIDQFEENHSNIEEKINDLKNIVIKYLPVNEEPELVNKLLIDLFMLEDDLSKHALIENRILVPLVTLMEG